MLHSIPKDRAGPQTSAMAHAVESCVHCGFCLPTCPTYVTLGEEMNSPRGRILLMKETLEGTLTVDQTKGFIDCCLGCLACETSCPSGVRYGELLTPFRAWAEPRRGRGLAERARRAVLLATLPHPARFRLALAGAKLARPLRGLLPAFLRPMIDLAPARVPPADPLPEVIPAQGKRRARVALLAGCAQQVLEPGIGRSTVDVLAANGVEVVVPRGQACCGGLALHIGAAESARATARRNLAAFPDDVDAVITNASGCGSALADYPLLFKGEPEEARAGAFAQRAADISTFLQRLGLVPPPALPRTVKIAYHDACHLAHAQRVRSAPRELLRQVPGLEIVEPAEWELCCGSAGTYNLENPPVADALGRRKAENLLATGAEAIALGNIGCLTQIDAHLRRLGRPLPVLHTVQVLDQAYRGELK
ncbi:MAG TPA: heterodisulfide reductase-related iron-sulfur binding cluster [Opitutaceae bacterium]|nr:heterodisulfide reductase-related iron-sulfur binding cluster [Opitutaceae bacterium]